MTNLKPLLLLVEDDERLRSRLATAFQQRGLDVREADDVASALQILEADDPELVLVDLRMPGESGLELIRYVKRHDPETRVVVLTGYGSIATALEAVRLGATHYLTKPADADEILAAFERTTEGRPAAPLELKPMSLSRLEWEHINRVLLDCDGNISRAARVLGIHRRSLQRKLAKYPVRR